MPCGVIETMVLRFVELLFAVGMKSLRLARCCAAISVITLRRGLVGTRVARCNNDSSSS